MPQFDTLSFFSQITWVFFTFGLTYLAVSFFVSPSISTVLKLRNVWSAENANTEIDLSKNATLTKESNIKITSSVSSKPSSLESTAPFKESAVGFVSTVFKNDSSLKPFFSNIAFVGFTRCHPF